MWIDAGRSRNDARLGKAGGSESIHRWEWVYPRSPCSSLRADPTDKGQHFRITSTTGFGRDPVVPLAVPYLAFVGADSRALDDLSLPNIAPVLSRLACQGIKSGQGPSKEKRSPQRLCRTTLSVSETPETRVLHHPQTNTDGEGT
jgi:hypothetical protein